MDEGNGEPQVGGATRAAWLRWLPLAAILGFSILAIVQGWHEKFTLAELADRRDWLRGLVETNALLTMLVYGAVYVVAVALSFPGASLLTVLGGFLFGWLWGGALAATAATLGASLIFLAARTSVGELLRRRSGGQIARLAQGFRKDAFHYLLFLRLVPLFPFWLVNLAPACFHVRLRTFVLATFFGILPGTFAYAWLGRGLDSILEKQARSGGDFRVADLVTWQILVAFAVLGLVALMPVVIKRLRGSTCPEEA